MIDGNLNCHDPNLNLYNFTVFRSLAAIVVWLGRLWGTTVHAADLNTELARIMRGRSGTAVVVDVASGQLLADYHPEIAARRLARPGSAFKPFTLLALLQSGKLRIEGDATHFLMVTFWESEVAIRAFAGDDISVAKYYDFDKDFLLELEPCSTHYEMSDDEPTGRMSKRMRTYTHSVVRRTRLLTKTRFRELRTWTTGVSSDGFSVHRLYQSR
jgi:hypothetical protein